MSKFSKNITVPDNWLVHPLIDDDQNARESCFSFLENSIASKDTKQTYRRALVRLMAHCADLGIDDIVDIEAIHIKKYVEGLKEDGKKATAKSAYYAVKGYFQHCVDDGVLSVNPAGSVKVKFKKPKVGSTRALTAAQVNTIILSIPDASDLDSFRPKHTDMRDRALITLMAFTFSRIGGALSCRLKDFYFDDGRYWLDMVEKGEDDHCVPVHKSAVEKLLEYIEYCGLTDPEAWLFQSADRNGRLSGKPYDRKNSLAMVKRRALSSLEQDFNVKNHTFRATGITNALDRGMSFELVQEMANHSDADTTKLYDKTRKRRLAEAMDEFDYE